MTTNIFVPESDTTEVAVLTPDDIGTAVAGPVEAATQTASAAVTWLNGSPVTLGSLDIAANEPATGSFYEVLASGTYPLTNPQFALYFGSTQLVLVTVNNSANSGGFTLQGWINFADDSSCFAALIVQTWDGVTLSFKSNVSNQLSGMLTPKWGDPVAVTTSSATTLSVAGIGNGSGGALSTDGSIQTFLITKRV